MSRSAANGLGYPQVNVTANRSALTLAVQTCSCVTLTSRPINWTYLRMDFATTATGSSDPEVEAVGQMAGGENSRLSGSRSSHSHTHTRKAPHKFSFKQRRNDAAMSTASGEHHTFYTHILPRQEVCLNE